MEPSKQAQAIIDYWERQREKQKAEGTYNPSRPRNGLGYSDLGGDNKNVIQFGRKDIPDDASKLFDSEGFYTGFKK